MNLFQSGDFTLHSGEQSALKIECDALTPADWDTLAAMVAERFKFQHAFGIPNGGLRFAETLNRVYAMREYPQWPILIVDDVLTTGASMEQWREWATAYYSTSNVIGVVVFARGECPGWIRPIFRMW